MKDAASAAAMSDPAMNRWFRRRWVELPAPAAPNPTADVLPVVDDLATTGLALLQEWRRRRQPGVVAW